MRIVMYIFNEITKLKFREDYETKLFIVFLILIAQFSFGQQYTDLYGDYLGQTLPDDTPVVFARGIVSRPMILNTARQFSLPTATMYTGLQPTPGPDNSDCLVGPLTMQRKNTDGPYLMTLHTISPPLSADGQHGYFRSLEDMDVWVAEKQGDNWSKPKCLNLVKRYTNWKLAADPSIANNGSLYFVGNAEGLGTLNNYGIYRAEIINGEYAKPQLLPHSINLPPFLNWTPFIASDENYLIFSSDRVGEFGEG